jgi:hypothetical protein
MEYKSFQILSKIYNWRKNINYKYVIENYNNDSIEIKIKFNRLHELCSNCNTSFKIKDYFSYPCKDDSPIFYKVYCENDKKIKIKCIILCEECINIFRYNDIDYINIFIRDYYFKMNKITTTAYYYRNNEFVDMNIKKYTYNIFKNLFIIKKKQRIIRMVLMIVLKY